MRKLAKDRTALEQSFVTLLKDNPNGMNTKAFIHAIKNIAYHSFGGKNIFEDEIFRTDLSSGQIQFHYLGFSTQLTEAQLDAQFERTGTCEELVSGITIPLAIKDNGITNKARLVIACPSLVGEHISVQFLLTENGKWVDVPCSPSTVKKTILALFH